jgi:hypothetical protein
MSDVSCVYVLELTDAGCPKGEEKPNPSLPCLYVGSSGKTADEALLDHETGRYPRRGTRGIPWDYAVT